MSMTSHRFPTILAVGMFALALPVGVALAAGSSSSTSTGNTSADAEYQAGQTAIAHNDYQKAIGHLQNVVQATPNNADALNLMGFSERKLGHMDQSLEYYNKALALQPNHLGANEYLGELYLDMKNVKKAEERLAVLQKACGGRCSEYNELKEKIDKFRTTNG
jgi:tetratricopeptide (TPR) repeat protein